MKLKLFSKNKQIIIFSAFILVSSFIFGQNVSQELAAGDYSASVVDETIPLMLEGIWENSNRYVIFDSSYVVKNNGRRIPEIALKNFYQWYIDRTAESDAYSITHPRPLNDSTSKTAQQLEIHFEPLTYELYTSAYNMPVIFSNGTTFEADQEISGAWDMQVKYPHDKTIYHIPLAVIGNKLYLKFKLRGIDENTQAYPETMNGFWRDEGNASGILVCPPIINDELLSYYVTDEGCYHIRYWETDMEYQADGIAFFNDGEKSFSVPKHLIAGDRNFTCVLGRRTKIRNITKTSKIPDGYTTNSVLVKRTVRKSDGSYSVETQKTSTICAFGEPYLVLTDGSRTFEEILALAAERKRPPKRPLFPVSGGPIDFDFSIKSNPPESYDRRLLDLGK